MSLRLGPMPLGEPPSTSPTRAFRLGIVKDQDAANCRVRVAFGEFDQVLSYWLPVVVAKTQNDKVYWLPDPGEQVVCLMDERDEAGVVLGAIYSQPDRPPVHGPGKTHIRFNDGAYVEYDRELHVMTINFQDGTSFTYDAASHVLNIAGSTEMTMAINGPNGIVFTSGGSQVSIGASGVSIVPPLSTTSTVAQT